MIATGSRNPDEPTLERFSAIARTAFDALPQQFRALCGNVVIHVADFAEDELLVELGISDRFELTGLYEGVNVTEESVSDPAATPSHVHLYRLPILQEHRERRDGDLDALVTHVLVHEIGHHFGLSDEQIHAIEEATD